jgi:ubiquinone/menaquinone biosynthesis C-methylase UbiE
MEGHSEFDPATYLGHNAVTPLRERIVRDMLGEFRGLRVLDAGCGDGSVSRSFLAHNHVTFLDVSASMLDEAVKAIPLKYISHADFVHAGLLEATFRTQFDVVVCLGVLAYIEDTERAIARLGGVLAPGGRCILQITDTDDALGRLIYNYARRRGQLVEAGRSRVTPKRMTRSQIVTYASRLGLAAVGEKRHLPTVPGMWRFGNRLSSRYLEWGLRRRLGCELYMELARP